MGKYLFQATYTAEGAKGLARDGGSKRRASLEKTIKGLGGKMESFYFAFGDGDAYAIADLPDNGRFHIEHPGGQAEVLLEISNGQVTGAGTLRTARKLFDGRVFPRIC